MPYTPPSQPSPVASRPESPALSRNHSYSRAPQTAAPSFTTTPRPGLPRSASSTSYLHKHRRSPSITRSNLFPSLPDTPDTTPPNQTGQDDKSGSPSKSRQLSPHLTGISIPSGTIISLSPPDSAQNSSDDEPNQRKSRMRQLENLAELQAAIRIIEQHRESSPNRAKEETRRARIALGLSVDTHSSQSEQEASNRPPLSKEARRISHSRSATESSAYLDLSSPFPADRGSVSDSEQDDSDETRSKPPMVRKKSGELVRPAIRPQSARRRPSSMPGTPTYSKAVHFDSNLEHVRHFLQVDRPLAVSAGSSPVEQYESDMEFPFGNELPQSSSPPWEWEIKLANFPHDTPERRAQPVRVEKVFLSTDKKLLIGAVAVANLSFHKLVVARFTLDYWKTTSEVVAEYTNDVRKQYNDGYDRFNFSIKLEDQANLETKTMFFCVRYNVNGQDYWDSNGGVNFQIDFAKKPIPQKGKQGMPGNASRPLNALPRSKPPASAGKPRPKTTSFEEFSTKDSPYDFGSFPQPASMTLIDTPIRFKTKPTNTVVPDAPSRRANAPAQAFGNRYDFGASLSAAIQAASADRSPPQSTEDPRTATVKITESSIESGAGNNAKATQANSNISATATAPKPAALTAEKPSLQSESYHELLNKYCFFGTAKALSSGKPGNGQVDGAADDVAIDFEKGSRSVTPSPPTSPPRTIEDLMSPTNALIKSPLFERTTSATSSPYRTTTTGAGEYGFPYTQNGLFGDGAFHATAIRG